MKIGIDCGHTITGPNYGAVGLIKESEETRVIGNKVIALLKQAGHTIVDCTVNTASNNTASLSSRVSKANAQSLDLFVSIHFNAGGGKGSEVFTYGGTKHSEAIRILENLNRIGFINRGVKDGSHLAVIKGTKARSMLVEVCFVDTKLDVDLYKKNIDNVAKAITEGVIGKTISNENNINESEEFNLVDTLKTSACVDSSLKEQMIEEIKILQGVVGISQDGVGTAKLCRLLPKLKGHEQRGCVTVMQRILILKGMLSKGSATGVIGEANKNGVSRFKKSVGIPESDILIDMLTWFKLLEY